METSPKKPIPAYTGDGDYVFICYAHDDQASVYPEISRLREGGVNVWYDEGITPGSSWTDELAHAIEGCTRLLFFVSPRSIASGYCLDEINFALEHGRDVACVYLQETELPPGLKLSLNRRQAVSRTGLSAEAFTAKLLQAATATGRSATEVSIAAGAAGRFRFRTATLLVVALLSIAVGIGVWMATSAPAAQASLLVLPFDELNLGDELSYLPMALNDDLISRLAQLPDVKLIASNSARRFSESERSVGEMAATAGVAHVLRGNLQHTGENFRVTAQLIRAVDEGVVWSKQFDSTSENLLDIQAAIASEISNALQLRLNAQLTAGLAASGTGSIEAFDAFLRGTQKNIVGARLNRPEEIIAPLLEAVSFDPDYADAWGLLALQEQIWITIVGRRPSNAKAHAERALELDPDNPRALRAMALVLANTDPERALLYASRALEIVPQNALIQTDIGIALNSLGRFREAQDMLERAVELDPANPIPRQNLVTTQLRRGLLDDARVTAQRGVELRPDNPFSLMSRAEVYFAQGDAFEGLRTLASATETKPLTVNEGAFILRLIQFDQLDGANSWNNYFESRSSAKFVYTVLRARIAQSAGDLEGFSALVAAWLAPAGPNIANTLPRANLNVMRARFAGDANERERLLGTAYVLYRELEAARPIDSQNITALITFTRLAQIAGDDMLGRSLAVRIDKLDAGDLWDTQRTMQLVLNHRIDEALERFEQMSAHGNLNLPVLQELDVIGEQPTLYPEISSHPRFLAAIARQSAANEQLAEKIMAEAPRLLRPADRPTP